MSTFPGSLHPDRSEPSCPDCGSTMTVVPCDCGGSSRLCSSQSCSHEVHLNHEPPSDPPQFDELASDMDAFRAAQARMHADEQRAQERLGHAFDWIESGGMISPFQVAHEERRQAESAALDELAEAIKLAATAADDVTERDSVSACLCADFVQKAAELLRSTGRTC